MRLRLSATAIALLALVLGITTADAATNYVCWKGDFYFSPPANYKQVDYRTVDSYLQSRGSNRSALNYEAVFADSTADPFFEGEYFILSYTPLDSLGQPQIDSVLRYYRHGFETGVRHAPFESFLEVPSKNVPYYDADLGVIAFTNDIGVDSTSIRRGMVVEKMYDKGIATFYFYAPDSLFLKHTIANIRDIIGSFSTENLDQAAKSEPVKVANLDNVDLQPEEYDKDEGSLPWLYVIGPLVVLGLILIGVAKRRKNARR